MNFQAQLYYLIAWILNIPPRMVSPAANLREDLNIDDGSFDLFIFQLENYYHQEFSDDELARIATVKDLGDVIAEKQNVLYY